MVRIASVLIVLVVTSSAALAQSLSSRLQHEIDARTICATLDFDKLEVNVEDGILDRSADAPDRVRSGDRLQVKDVDISRDGLDVELEVVSQHTRGESVDVEIVFYKSLRGPDDELVNLDEFWKAMNYFSTPCEAKGTDAG